MNQWVASVLMFCVWAVEVDGGSGRHVFYRDLEYKDEAGATGTRRVFGGAVVALSEYPAVCVLMDRYWGARCSAALVAPYWAVTAAHCITPRISYVKYNTRRPTSSEGEFSPIHYLYKHPKYMVVQEDEGHGIDVTVLHHDVGLVRTRTPMTLNAKLLADPLVAMRRYDSEELYDQEVKIMGFGRTEQTSLGEELFGVQLLVVECERSSWMQTTCGVAVGVEARGVCAGDSGGPVIYRGMQVAVTSMGPVECSQRSQVPATATSVFTTLHSYVDLLNATIHDTDHVLRMTSLRSLALSVYPCLCNLSFASVSALLFGRCFLLL